MARENSTVIALGVTAVVGAVYYYYWTTNHRKEATTDEEASKNPFGIAPRAEIKLLLQNNEEVIILDVRTSDEIDSFGKVENSIHIPCTPDDASQVVADFPKNISDQPIVVYCRSGRRAATAKKALETAFGYSIWNAGGYDDIKNCV
mmetsp:Transcript_15304/g.23276  ORF Transcript_15304/g.23276 Transcript_15304/m.23276 type:complete len:147 (-) Transcript_15304:215-655(-)